MRASRLVVLTAVALSMAMASHPPARATQGIASFKHDLKRIEDHLRAGEWQPAKDSCDRLLKDLIKEYARGRGARPLFGLTLAFRAVAETGLADVDGATWDWSAAGLLSPAATSFDLARFDDAGSRLREALARPLETTKLPEGTQSSTPVVPPKRIAGSQPSYPEAARLARFQGTIQVHVVIDKRGVPIRIADLEARDLEEHTAVAVTALEALKGWRFQPATILGAPVNVYYNLVVNYRLGGTPIGDQEP